MQFLRCNEARPNADVMSGILNCVCPECGGRMGGAGKEFQVPGRVRYRLAPSMGAGPVSRLCETITEGDQTELIDSEVRVFMKTTILLVLSASDPVAPDNIPSNSAGLHY